MENSQLELIKKIYKIITYKINENYILTNIDHNHKYYMLYNYLYTLDIIVKNNYFTNTISKIKTFNAFVKINDKSKDLIIYNKNNEKKYRNLLYLSYDKINIYKTMDGFYNKSEDEAFLKSHRNTPFWFSSAYNAFLAIDKRRGGINAYKLKENNNLNILIINCDNIKILISIAKKIKDNNISIRNYELTKTYLINLLRLSACSENGLLDQMNIYAKMNNYGKELWLTEYPQDNNYQVSDITIDNTSYFGITKSKGYHNYNFAYFIQYLNKKYFDNFFDGYIIKYSYTPYFPTGVSLEEIILFDPYNKLYRDLKDKYDWTNYISELDLKIPKKLKFRDLLSTYNNDFQLYKFYNKKYNSSKNSMIKKKIKDNLSIIFLNCNNFESINTNDSIESNKKNLSKLLNFMSVDIVILIYANNYENKNYNIFIENKEYKILVKNESNKYINILKTILLINFNFIKLKHKTINFSQFDSIVTKNYNNFIIDIKKKKYSDYNIIFTYDSYLNFLSPEVKFLKNKYNLVNEKNEFLKSNNFLFYKNNVKYFNLLDYNYSYYLPYILLLNKSNYTDFSENSES
jgi:hypothetical protein